MALCTWCGRSGLFLSVSKEGLCQNCNSVVNLQIQNHLRIITDSIKLVKETKKMDIRVSRLDLIIEHAKSLIEFENKGISICQPPPSQIYRDYLKNYDNIILNALESDIQEKLKKSEITLTSPKSKITQLSKILFQISEIEPKLKNPDSVKIIKQDITEKIHQVQLDSYLDDAKKAEFKGKKKIALDKYYEALYFLQHDDIDDSLQLSSISQIKSKILELGGSISD